MGIDILGIDIMGVDILGIDIPAPTHINNLGLCIRVHVYNILFQYGLI